MQNQENYYEDKYSNKDFYWGLKPSKTCFKLLELKPPDRQLKLLDIGSGEGRNAIFFAINGYQVTAFDLAQAGINKTRQLADQIGVDINVFKANILDFRLAEEYDVIFSTGSLHYIPADLREEIFGNYKKFTAPDGVHMLSVFVKKPFIPPAPEREKNSHMWLSGELFTLYHDWKIDYCIEEIFDCNSSGIPHKHATNRLLARKITTGD